MASTNEILGSIYRTLLSVDKKLSEAQKNSNSKTKSNPNSWFGFSQPQQNNTGTGKFTDFANGVKALSGVKISDIAAISVSPIGLVAIKIKSFYETLGEIDKKQVENAKKSIEGFTSLMTYIEKSNPAKLWTAMFLFPVKRLNKFIDDLSKIDKKLADFGNMMIKTFSPQFTKQLKESAENLKSFVKDLGKLNAYIALGGMATVVLMPAILIGIGAYRLSLSIINKLVFDVKTTNKNVRGSKTAIFNVLLFVKGMTGLLATIALTGLALTAVGGWAAVGLGLTMMAGSVLGVLGLSHIVRLVGTKVGSKSNKVAMKEIFFFIGSAVLLAVSMTGVGALLNAVGGLKAMGMGIAMMTASMLLVFGLTWVVKFVGTSSKKSLPSFKNILLFIGASLLMSVAITGLGVISQTVGWEVIKSGLIMTGMSVLMVGAIAVAAKFAGDSAKKAFLPMLGIIVLGGLMELLAYGMIKLGKATKEAGGWPAIGNALGVVAATIGEMTVITLAIGGLMMIPVLPIVMGAGIATLTGLGIAFLTITSAAKKMVEIGRDVKTNEIKTSSETTSAFIDAMKGMITNIGGIELTEIGKAIAAMIPVRNLINSMAIFANLLYNFAGDPGYLKVRIGTDKDGNPIFDKKGIDVEQASSSISTGFKTFIEKVIPAVSDAEAQTIRASAVRRINRIMEPVSKFASILQAFVMDEKDGSKIQIAHYNEKGELVRGQVIDIPKIGEALGNGFGTFVHEIFSRMDVVEENMVSRGTIRKINNLMKPVTSFVDIVSMFESAGDNKLKKVVVNEEGKIKETKEIDIVAIGNTIANNFDSFVTVVSKSLVSVEKISADGAKKKIEVLRKLTDGISGFAEQLEKSFSSDEELAKFKKNSDEINSALRNIGDLYKSSLDESLSKNIPILKKNHHDFLNALEKDTKSVKKPLQEYINLLKEVNAQYDKLVPHTESLNKNSVTFVLDQGTKYETKMDDDAIQKIADAYSDNLSPIIQSAIAEVIDSITATPVYKSDKTLQQITFDAAVGSV